ncbi:hypothetical protein [Pseudomonas sp. dw_612]|uniref:hypothetical protein n=1 Tax=Pseudomonas sp. dw_612 TaxID=2720080 RepID=UPI001BD33D1C|nr:hypothetical protein [Pseudomonas sp. dw_612]
MKIRTIFVLFDFMQQGIGLKRVNHLEGLSRDPGLEEANLDAALNAADFYRCCGFVGDVAAVNHSSSGLQLACVPMVKSLLL